MAVMSSESKREDDASNPFEGQVRRWFPHDHMVLVELPLNGARS